MATSLGDAGGLIAARTPVPATVVPALIEQFGAALAHNSRLSTATRIEWLRSHKTSAAEAVALCGHAFSAAEVAQIVEMDSRASVLRILAAHHRESDVLEVLLGSRNGKSVAEKCVGSSTLDPTKLLPFFDHLPRNRQVQLLLSCPPDKVSDAQIADLLTQVKSVGRMSNQACRDVRNMLRSLVQYRPLLTAELRSIGFPPICLSAVAGSVWITDDDVAELLKQDIADCYQEELAANPWVRLDGPAADQLTAHREVLEERRTKAFAEATAAPWELEGDLLRYAWIRALPASTTGDHPQLQMMLLLSPNLPRPTAQDLGARLMHNIADAHTPRWVHEAVIPVFEANYPGAVPANVQKWLAGPPPYNASEFIGPVRPKASIDVFEKCQVSRLQYDTHNVVNAALARFAVALGDSEEAWTAALAMADSFNGSLAELAEVATAATFDLVAA